ncbi:MAG TPA: hypothetical protein DCY48_00170 [Candidatus Magasanikbacteria bacterium]|nr:hypothetical protein [Candidatus Magasanikbacteria bacterium]
MALSKKALIPFLQAPSFITQKRNSIITAIPMGMITRLGQIRRQNRLSMRFRSPRLRQCRPLICRCQRKFSIFPALWKNCDILPFGLRITLFLFDRYPKIGVCKIHILKTTRITMKKILFFIFPFFSLCLPVAALAKIPNDPFAAQWAFEHIYATEAWDITTGSKDVVVAIIDNGFDTFHPDLESNVWVNTKEIADDGIDNDKNGYIDDVYGWNFFDNNNDPRPPVAELSQEEKNEGIMSHGTVVAGLIGAVGNNNRDGVGLNWKVKIMNVKVIGNEGSGEIKPLSEAIQYAINNGADIINVSMVGDPDSSLKKAIDDAYDKGVLIVAAAGNTSQYLNLSPLYPVCVDANQPFDSVIGVSAIDKSHRIASFSNTGSSCIDITAPGVDIYSTVRYSPNNGLTESYEGGWNGTSFAAPLVSGAAALIKAIQPGWTGKEIAHAILQTTHHTLSDDEAGYADLFGAGLLQVNKAVAYALGEKQTLSMSLGSLAVVKPKTGEVSEKKVGENTVAITAVPAVKGANKVATFMDEGKIRHTTIKYIAGKKWRVSLYTDDWEKIVSWFVQSSFAPDIAGGAVGKGGSATVFVAIPGAKTTTIEAYTTQGKKQYAFSFSTEAPIASIAVVPAASEEPGALLSLFSQKGVIHVGQYDTEGKSVQTLATTLPLSPYARVIVADMDNDGKNEYVVSGHDRIVIMNQKGTVAKTIFPYGDAAGEGFDLAVTDYDTNGKPDILVVPFQGGGMARIFDGKGKKIMQWWPFEKNAAGPFFLLQ